MHEPTPPTPGPAEPHIVRPRVRFSMVWLVPIVAVLIGLALLVHSLTSEGPEITITFHAATGLEAGKTPVKYKDVTVGTVSSISLTEDGAQVEVKVKLSKSAQPLLREDTRFWVVRPRIGAGGVSGIDTLLSGAYLAVDQGVSDTSSKSFEGLENPPTVLRDMRGKSFVLHAKDMGSLDIGSPVYYRRLQVGRVTAFRLGDDGSDVTLQVFVDAPYDKFVTTDSRFWNASGVDVALSADGLKLKTQSLSTIVAGGVAFAAPEASTGKPADSNAEFTLMADQDVALAPQDGAPQFLQMRFEQSLRGLSVGAPVNFSGVNLGKVVAVDIDYDAKAGHFLTVVGVNIYPQRLGSVLQKMPKLAGTEEQKAAQFLSMLVARGFRAQARMGNLLTGQLYISLDFVHNAPKVAFDVAARPVNLPTINGGYDRLQEQVSNIVASIEKMPLESIGKNLDSALHNLNGTLQQVNGSVLPETTQTLQQVRQTMGTVQGALDEDAPLQQNVDQTLQEVQRSARSLRALTDLLGRRPESLLRGLPPDATPAKPSPAKSVPSEETKP